MDQKTHFLLKEKIAGLPQVDAVTMIDADDKPINFPRYWLIPAGDNLCLKEAHSLKSSAGTSGYRDLASLAEKLGEGARWLTDGGYRELLDRMDAAHSAATAEEPRGGAPD